MMQRLGALAGATLVAAVLAGCSVFEGGGDGERLEGERISVLDLERKLEPDKALASAQVTLPRPYVNESWTQAGGTASHAMYHLALPADLARQWSVDAGAAADTTQPILAEPVVADGRIYVMDAEMTVHAFRAQTGKALWTRDLVTDEEADEGAFGGGLAVEDGRLFATTGTGAVHALAGKSGKVRWTTNLGTPLRAGPSVKDGTLYVLTIVNETVALATEDGSERWRHTGVQEQAGLLGSASPAIGSGSIVSAYSSGQLTALLADNGRDLWTDSLAGVRRASEVADMADIRGLPVIDRRRVFAVSNSGPMVSVNMRTGARAWERELASAATPWAAGNYVYVLTTNARVAALRRKDGKVRWVTKIAAYADAEAKADPIHWTGPMLAGDRVILMGSHGVAASLSPYTGELLGTMSLPGAPAVPPVVANETLYLLTRDATLVAYR